MQTDNDVAILSVMYHYVRNQEDTTWTGIHGLDVATFCKQLDLLCHEMEPISWPMFFGWRMGRTKLPERSFLLTFDDGLSDHAEVVAPLLESRGLYGTFFVPGKILGGGCMLAAHQVHLLQARLGDDDFSEEVSRWLTDHEPNSNWLAQIDCESDSSTGHFETRTADRLKYLVVLELPIEIRDQMIDDLFEQHVGSISDIASKWYMGMGDLCMLSKAGHTIGGQGFAHESLVRLSKKQRMLDLSRSRAILCEALGPSPRPMSYPFGSVNSEVAMHVMEAGFVQGFTTQNECIDNQSDPFLLGRADTIEVDAIFERDRQFALT